ncbi:putative peroxiredoxin bcp [Enhygromyxa salina]|uniref:thioredoxin-dependent peroxiredoxin n=1 Tax=Enhygromyxa salina TaxID=215803 RepID=A0A2S9Y1L8_9BACT|nr:peroxiredoxin [Enhygromyxa salina]PRP99008.1 putative peroxiredoxin bcp [Enhygromyxa salina]
MRRLATPLVPRLAVLLLCLAMPVASGACGETQRPDGGTGLLEAGVQAPKLEATAHDGTELTLGSLAKPAVVYFYPADDTPGCTKEACAFRDIWSEYEAAGVMVIGVSTQDNESHREFAEKHEIPFPLVADTDKRWATAFGVKLRGGYAARVSFLLDRDGKVVEVYPGVDPGVHAREVLDDAAKL